MFSVHKIQGQTVEKTVKSVVDLKSVFEGAQAYVMLSRMKEMDQLHILDELPEKKIYPILKAQNEITRLETISINKNPNAWDKKCERDVVRICSLNCRSLLDKFYHVRSDQSLRQSDVLVLAETWLQKDIVGDKKYELEGYDVHFNSTGRGKGLAIFFKIEFENVIDYNEEKINITKLECDEFDMIAVYRSADGSLDRLVSKLLEILNLSKSTVVVGDMNVCNQRRPDNVLKTLLEELGFKEWVRQATHIEGGHLDHAYILNVRNFKEEPIIYLVPKYYSDHDALCICLQKSS